MKKGEYVSAVLRSNQTVFSFKDILMLWGEQGAPLARVRMSYYTRHGKLYRIRRGFYAKDKNYDKFELAAKIFTPSYISFETVLAKEGLIFQFYSQIFVASYLTRETIVDNQAYLCKKIKMAILTNPEGIRQEGNYPIATKERAFLDTVYLYKDYHFDNLSVLDWDKVFELLSVYDNGRMNRKVEMYHKAYKAGD